MKELIEQVRTQAMASLLAGHDNAQSVLTKAADALESYQWNTDMDAAPKDGTWVMFISGVKLEPNMTVWWCSYRDGAWLTDDDFWAVSFHNLKSWMPLPPAPEGV